MCFFAFPPDEFHPVQAKINAGQNSSEPGEQNRVAALPPGNRPGGVVSAVPLHKQAYKHLSMMYSETGFVKTGVTKIKNRSSLFLPLYNRLCATPEKSTQTAEESAYRKKRKPYKIKLT